MFTPFLFSFLKLVVKASKVFLSFPGNRAGCHPSPPAAQSGRSKGYIPSFPERIPANLSLKQTDAAEEKLKNEDGRDITLGVAVSVRFFGSRASATVSQRTLAEACSAQLGQP